MLKPSESQTNEAVRVVEAVGIEPIAPSRNYPENQGLESSKAGSDPVREGWIYFVQGLSGGPVKVGFAINAASRLVSLQIGSPVRLHVAAKIPGTLADEKRLHGKLAASRVSGEWFWPSAEMRRILGRQADAILPGREGFDSLPYRAIRDGGVCYVCERSSEPDRLVLKGVCQRCCRALYAVHYPLENLTLEEAS